MHIFLLIVFVAVSLVGLVTISRFLWRAFIAWSNTPTPPSQPKVFEDESHIHPTMRSTVTSWNGHLWWRGARLD